MRIEVEGKGNFNVGRAVEVGGEVRITGVARVVGMSEELVDTTFYQSNVPQYSPGEMTFKLLLLSADIEAD